MQSGSTSPLISQAPLLLRADSDGYPLRADLSCRSTLQNVGTLYTQSNFVTLKYVTDQWGPKDNGFRLLITAFKDKSECAGEKEMKDKKKN
ncbi:hypothetical protein E2C01_068437 [Portunus trituberculatus]|uniref:CUB domain-containing protein n=1 Tax=Portunus trituberculatus TaxID=210409 RepID=A0A5B7HME6_PORTR|nr:hypothetical protein [Portunus trituberculatus]